MAPDLLLPGDEPGLSPLARADRSPWSPWQAEEQHCLGTAGTEVPPARHPAPSATASAATRFLSENGGKGFTTSSALLHMFWGG